jgi:hypothetical protein
MTTEDVEYYRQRVTAELQLASAADRADVASIHEELARQYQALVEQEELRPASHIVGASS